MYRGSSGFPFCLVQNLRSPVLVHQSLDCFVVVVLCGCESYFFCGMAGCDLLFHCTLCVLVSHSWNLICLC